MRLLILGGGDYWKSVLKVVYERDNIKMLYKVFRKLKRGEYFLRVDEIRIILVSIIDKDVINFIF